MRIKQQPIYYESIEITDRGGTCEVIETKSDGGQSSIIMGKDAAEKKVIDWLNGTRYGR